MQATKLNTNVDKLFKNIKSDDINIDTIEKYVSIDSTNDYGNTLHALVNSKYSEEKMFSVMKVLLDNGIKVNYKGKVTGYSFIHLALYGYTDIKGEDHSYSTDFIVKLINLAKDYGFDVNIKDNDGDTLIHTALASEVYTGEILPLIDALGSDYNLFKKDGEGRNIYEALLDYEKEASRKKTWLNRLRKEEKNINILINFDKDSTYKNINEKVNSLNDNLKDLNNFLENYKNIANTLKKLKSDIENYNKNVTDDFIDSNNILSFSVNAITSFIDEYYNIVSSKLNNKDITNLINIASLFSFYDIEKINKLKEDYTSIINKYDNRLKSSDTINKYNDLLKDLENLNDKEYLTKTKDEIKKELDLLSTLIDSVNNTISKKNMLLKTMNLESQITEYNNLLDLNKKALEELKNSLDLEIAYLQKDVVEDYKKEYIALVNKYKTYIEKSLIPQEMFEEVVVWNDKNNNSKDNSSKNLVKKKRES